MANSISFKTTRMKLQNAEESNKIGLPSQILLNNKLFIMSCPRTMYSLWTVGVSGESRLNIDPGH